MYELIQAGKRTYYIDCPSKVGIYCIDAGQAVLIDSGNDKDAGKKILKILESQGWQCVGIINTHSNADHIGGNGVIQKRTGCKIYTTALEGVLAKYTVLEPSFLYGGFPPKKLRGKFLMADPSVPNEIIENGLPEGLSSFPLPGHFFDMIGIRTADHVCFLADCLFGENILNKYHISYVYDVKKYLETLEAVSHMEGCLFIPSHGDVTDNIQPLAEANMKKVQEIITVLLDICIKPICFEDILKRVFDKYGLFMDFNQYALIGSAIKSYLAYLLDGNLLSADFIENRLLWRRK